MSTTEELATAVQMGEQDRLLALWDAVRPFAAKTARRWAAAAGDRSGVTLDDLMQESFLALLDALEGWRADDGAFLTVWSEVESGLYGGLWTAYTPAGPGTAQKFYELISADRRP